MKTPTFAMLIFLLTSCNLAQSQNEFKFTTRIYGPFNIGVKHQHNITIHVKSVAKPKKDCDFPNTDLNLVCTDENSIVVYSTQGSNNCDWSRTFRAEEVKLPTSGTALLVLSRTVPGEPGGCINGQFFSYNNRDKFIPITNRISPFTDNMSPDQFPIIKKSNHGHIGLFVRLLEWSGNFEIVTYCPIHLEGTNGSQLREIAQSKYEVQIDTKDAKERRKRAGTDTISLFSAPSKLNSAVIKICIRQNTKIVFLDASDNEWDPVHQRNPWWLHVIISGKEGFVPEEDFDALGLPAAG
jgi:hypothetical protein